MAGLAEAAAAAARELELRFAAEEQRQIELTAQERWARDPVGWINQHVWIASVFADDGIRRRVRPIRMRLFPDQERTIGAWIDLDQLAAAGELRFRNVVIEKSRQIGETWLFAAVICWILLHHRVVGGALHTNGNEIDDGGERNTLKSLFGKVRYIADRVDRDRAPGLGRLRFWPLSNQGPAKIENLQTGSIVYGEGQKDSPFRGSTLDYALIDEAAFVRHGELVHGAIDDACPAGKAYLSTVNGDDNVHARLADQEPEGWTYLRLHWSTHPVYGQGVHVAGDDPGCALCAGVLAGLDWTPRAPVAHRYPGKLTSPWYDQAVIGKTDEQVARELDIDREAALTARVYSEFQTERHVVPEGIRYDPALPVEFAWDFGLDVTAVVVLQDAPRELNAIGLLEVGDRVGTTATPELVAAALRELLLRLGVPARETTPFWTLKMQGYGDPSGEYGRTTGPSEFIAYRRQGFSIIGPPRHLQRVETTIAAVKRLLLGTPKPLRICGVNAAELARHFRNNRWPVDPYSGNRRKGSTRPEDDIHNHALRALAYYAVAKFPPPVEHDPEFDGAAGRSPHRRRDGVGDVRYDMPL